MVVAVPGGGEAAGVVLEELGAAPEELVVGQRRRYGRHGRNGWWHRVGRRRNWRRHAQRGLQSRSNYNNSPFNRPRTIVPQFPTSASSNQQILAALAEGTGGFTISIPTICSAAWSASVGAE